MNEKLHEENRASVAGSSWKGIMVEIHKIREGPVFEYVLKLWVQGKDGQLVPEEAKPKIDKAFNELFDSVDRIFAEYELEGPKVV